MLRIKKIISIVLPSLAVFLLAGCNKLSVINPAGSIASHERWLVITGALLILLIVVPVWILSLLIPFWYRKSNKKAKYDPSLTHGVKIEIFWWAVPCIIILVLSIITWISTHKLDPFKPLKSNVKPISIQVVSLNWRWLFIYPKQNIATINYVAFPEKTPINFSVTSDGGMNSFMIQRLGGQIYAMTGARTKIHLIADQTGVFNGRSVSFSGEGFAGMTFKAASMSKKDFNKWVHSVKTKKGSLSLTMSEYAKLVPNSEDHTVRYFKSVAGDLFRKIIMKYMGPMKGSNHMKNDKLKQHKN